MILISLMDPFISKKSWITAILKKFSTKPTMYKAILKAVPKNKVIPILPPIGKPKLRESI